MESLSWEQQPIKDTTFTGYSGIVIWLMVILVCIFLLIITFARGPDPTLSYLLMSGVAFASIFIVRNINYLRKYRHMRLYQVDNGGLTIRHSNKQEVYPWEEVEGWIESRVLDQAMYEADVPNESAYDRIATKAIAEFGKANIKGPNWVDLKLKNNRIVILDVPSEYFERLVTLLNKHTRHLDIDKYL